MRIKGVGVDVANAADLRLLGLTAFRFLLALQVNVVILVIARISVVLFLETGFLNLSCRAYMVMPCISVQQCERKHQKQ